MQHKITIHPINRPLMQQLNIYDTDTVKAEKVGDTLEYLVSVGYEYIQVHHSLSTTYEALQNIHYHCKKV